MKINIIFCKRKIKLFFIAFFSYLSLIFLINYISSFRVNSGDINGGFRVFVPGIYQVVINIDNKFEEECIHKHSGDFYIKSNNGNNVDFVKINRVSVVTGGNRYFIFSRGFLDSGDYKLNFSKEISLCKKENFYFMVNIRSSSSAIFSVIEFLINMLSVVFPVYFLYVIFLISRDFLRNYINKEGKGDE